MGKSGRDRDESGERSQTCSSGAVREVPAATARLAMNYYRGAPQWVQGHSEGAGGSSMVSALLLHPGRIGRVPPPESRLPLQVSLAVSAQAHLPSLAAGGGDLSSTTFRVEATDRLRLPPTSLDFRWMTGTTRTSTSCTVGATSTNETATHSSRTASTEPLVVLL